MWGWRGMEAGKLASVVLSGQGLPARVWKLAFLQQLKTVPAKSGRVCYSGCSHSREARRCKQGCSSLLSIYNLSSLQQRSGLSSFPSRTRNAIGLLPRPSLKKIAHLLCSMEFSLRVLRFVLRALEVSAPGAPAPPAAGALILNTLEGK